MRTRYFMGIKLEERRSGGEALLDRLPYPKRRLGGLVLEGKVAEAALMLRESPKLLPFFCSMLEDTSCSSDAMLGYQAQRGLALECLGSKADETVFMLSRMLECGCRFAESLAAKSLKAATDEGADLLFAEKALRRSLDRAGLSYDTSAALACHYLGKGRYEEIAWMLRHRNGMVNAIAANILSSNASRGDGSALALLVGACSDPDQGIRMNAASKLGHALSISDGGPRKAILKSIRELKDSSSLVYLDVVRELDIMERLVASGMP